MKTKNLLEILSIPSPSGWEKEGQQLWIKNITPFADRVESDPYGNAWAVLDGSDAQAPRVMLEAHADEIGFIVRYIDDKGFLAVGPIGGSDRTLAPARRIRLFGSKGIVPGVIGNTAIHLRDRSNEKPADWKDLFIDVGASSAKGVEKLGIRVGTPAIFVDDAIEFAEDRIVGRALDNRVGGFMIAEVARLLKENNKKLPFGLYITNSVQEEIGLRGAEMITQTIKPNVAIVTDVTHDTTTPMIDVKKEGLLELGKGPVFAYAPAVQQKLRDLITTTAIENKIPFQRSALSRATGTDTDAFAYSNGGVASALISLPLRYMHTTVEMVHREDVENVIKMIYETLLKIEDGETFSYFK